MKNFFIKLGRFIRVIDERSLCLSLTNIAVIIMLFKLVVVPAVSIVDIGALLVTLLSYSGKKVMNAKKPTEMEMPAVIDEKIKALETTMDNLKSKMGTISLANSMRPTF